MTRFIILLALALFSSVPFSQEVGAKDKTSPFMTVQFSVVDYAAWRLVFDAAEPMRAKANIKNPRIYRSADKPNEILVIFDVASKKERRAWIQSPSLREAWAKGGVMGHPIVGFVSFKEVKQKAR